MQTKRIVIVGGSFGGRAVLEQLRAIDKDLQGFEVVWVDKLSYFEYICSNYEAFVDTKVYDQNTADFKDYVKVFDQDNISFVQGMLKEVRPGENEIIIENESGKAESLSYDTLVISTGAAKEGVWRPEDDAAPSKDERRHQWIEQHGKVQGAESILCVGGGVTGVELAAILKEHYPEKRVALCQKGDKILPQSKGGHEKAVPFLQKIGVEVMTNTAYSEGSALQSEFDLVLNCLPGSVQGPRKFMTGELASAVEKQTGQIMVNEHHQVTNVHPIASKKPASPQTWENIFSFGDCCLTPLNEYKQISSIMQLSPIFARNVYDFTSGASALQPIPEHIHKMQLIPLGRKNGLMMFNKVMLKQSRAFTDKLQYRNGAISMMRGDPLGLKLVAKQGKQAKMFFGLASGWLSILPIHINKIKAQNKLDLAKARAHFDKLA